MKFRFPHCDISTGKIYGCEPGSFSWFHEEGHLKFNSVESTSFIIYLRGLFFTFWIVFTTFAVLGSKLCAIISLESMFAYGFLGLYEELWCDRYAKSKIKLIESERRE